MSADTPFRRIADGARALPPRRLARGLVDQFMERDLLVEAGAIAFRILLTLIPGVLFIFGLMGFFGLDEIWRSDIAPDLKDGMSAAAFKVLDQAVLKVLTSEQIFWVTAGLALAVWQVSGVVRASQDVLVRIYGQDEDEPGTIRRIASSIAVGAAVGVALIAALVIVRLGPFLFEDLIGTGAIAAVVSFVVRWLLVALLLFLSVGLVLRTTPGLGRPLHWVSFGALVVVVAWIVMTVLFGLYLTQLASYGSIFGNLATVFVLGEYLFLVAVVFLGGLVIDELVESAS